MLSNSSKSWSWSVSESARFLSGTTQRGAERIARAFHSPFGRARFMLCVAANVVGDEGMGILLVKRAGGKSGPCAQVDWAFIRAAQDGIQSWSRLTRSGSRIRLRSLSCFPPRYIISRLFWPAYLFVFCNDSTESRRLWLRFSVFSCCSLYKLWNALLVVLHVHYFLRQHLDVSN